MKNYYFLVSAVLLLAAMGMASYLKNTRNHSSDTIHAEPLAGGSAQKKRVITENIEETERTRLDRKVPKGAYSVSRRAYVTSDNALEVIHELVPRAQAGDAEAALSLYLKLQACKGAIGNEPEPEWVDVYRKAGVSAEALMQDDSAKTEDCLGVDQMQRDRGKWLEQAAKSGLAEAQLLYSNDVESVIGDESDMLREPEKIQQYKIDSARYLNSLASNGNVEAMLRLAIGYDQGVMLKQDAVRAYAYYRAAQMAMPSQVPEVLVQIQKEKVSADRRAQGERLARRINASCCGR